MKYEKSNQERRNVTTNLLYLTIALNISQTTLLFDTQESISVFMHGHSLSNVANSKHFKTTRGNFKSTDVKNFPRAWHSNII